MDSPLRSLLPRFEFRRSQQQMAECIEQVLHSGGVLIAESGTGTGKTIAYIVPALLCGKKVMISTGTKHLQDQLFQRDLPLVRDALAITASVSLLKGRANYLCRYRLQNAALGWPMAADNVMQEDFDQIQKWAEHTRDGDVAELASVAEDSPIWPRVTSTVDNCLGSTCSHYNNCCVNRARKNAADADVVVVNHHLYCADLVLREDGFGKLLPDADAVIFDEAHQLPQTLSHFLGTSLTSHQLVELSRDSVQEHAEARAAVVDLDPAATRLQKAVADLMSNLGNDVRRAPWTELEHDTDTTLALTTMQSALQFLGAVLEVAAPVSEGLDRCWLRCQELQERLLCLTQRESDEAVRWFETTPRAFRLHSTPLDTGAAFRQQVETADCTWIFTSATLTVAGSFNHFQTQLGLDIADTQQWDSPFDFARQALLYLPSDMPDPSSEHHTTSPPP
ncbi:MAG: ATP-dependent DNA helicase, partial [Gammaproteobacteria bacterium]|nr:ATP-dependent DNA helicase [Gammaproteobacteria bacterium]